MKTQFTPGPWEMQWDRERQHFGLRSKTDGSFGHFVGWAADGVTTDAEDEANARLIASAPELLVACQVTLQAIREFEAGKSSVPPHGDALRAAIAKATGEHTQKVRASQPE